MTSPCIFTVISLSLISLSSFQELQKGPPSPQCLGAELVSPECCDEAEHPSPNSVLEVPFTEDTPSSESFERVNADLHGMYLFFLTMLLLCGPYGVTQLKKKINNRIKQIY